MNTTHNEGFPEDFVTINLNEYVYPSGVVSLRGLGAHIGSVPIVCMGPELADHLEIDGFCTPGQLARKANEIAASTRDTSEPGDVGYPIFEGSYERGDGSVQRVWIEQFDTDAASIYYPHER